MGHEGGDFVMRALIAAVVVASVSLVSGANAQMQRQDATVSTGVVVVPPPATPPPGAAPAAVPFASATVRSVTVQPVCETQRRQFSDETGWRVRDVRVCN
jgi:hypothetical protein